MKRLQEYTERMNQRIYQKAQQLAQQYLQQGKPVHGMTNPKVEQVEGGVKWTVYLLHQPVAEGAQVQDTEKTPVSLTVDIKGGQLVEQAE